MKKWAVLLALPYIVVTCGKVMECWNIKNTETGLLVNVGVFPDKGMADDMAEALNDAHEKRTEPPFEVGVISGKPIMAKPCPCLTGGSTNCVCTDVGQ